jgi:hypothetical protein
MKNDASNPQEEPRPGVPPRTPAPPVQPVLPAEFATQDTEQSRQPQRPGGGGAPGTGEQDPVPGKPESQQTRPFSNPSGRREGVVSDPDRHPERS